MKAWPIFSVLIILLAACTVNPQQDIVDSIDTYLTDLELNQEFSGSVLVARDGEVLISKGYGFTDLEKQIQNSPQTRYRIHWLTMPFTAMVIMQLQAEGKLDVQDSICQYLSKCPEYWQEITLHHLLTHTSGVSDSIRPWGDEDDKPTTGEERVMLLKDKAPYFSPGEQLRYSENGYIILGAIIESISGKSYDGYIEEFIFDPMGMKQSGYHGIDIAEGHKTIGVEAPIPDLLFRYSASGLYSTVEDLYKWDQALYGEELLVSEDLDKIFTGYALTPSMDFPGAEYGYGWFIGEMHDRQVIFHGGMGFGYTSMILRFPDERITIIILRNYEMVVYDRLEIVLAEMLFGEN